MEKLDETSKKGKREKDAKIQSRWGNEGIRR